MAICDIKFTWKQRKLLHRCITIAILTNVTIGFVLFLLGTFPPFSIEGKLQLAERNLTDLVFKTVALYGLYIFIHNLVGVKLCYNYFHYAEGSYMSLRLFAWSVIGMFVMLVGCFLGSLYALTAENLLLEIRGSLAEGMKKYLTDVNWKRKIDGMQIHMQCCGIDSFADWHKTYWLQRDHLVLSSPDILEYAELDGRVMPPVVPWSCCRRDAKGPCYHDPLQLPNLERDSTYESLNTRGCLLVAKTSLDGTLYSSLALIALLFVSQVGVIVLSRFSFTAARNAVALGNRWGSSPGWLYGRLDFGNASGPNLCQIDRKNSGRGDSMIDLRPLVYTSDTE